MSKPNHTRFPETGFIANHLQAIADSHTGTIEKLALQLEKAIEHYIAEFDAVDTANKFNPAQMISLDDVEDCKRILIDVSRNPVVHGVVGI